MKDFSRIAKRARSWACLVICLAVVVGGCQSKEPSLSKAALSVKEGLLGEMGKLTAALAEPAGKRDWLAAEPILKASYEEMKKTGKFVPMGIVVLDRDGVTQDRFPPVKRAQMDFSNYAPAKSVLEEKKKTAAMLYLEGAKIFIFMAPLLHQDQVTGAVALGFPEGELQKWRVSEKEILGIDFNQ